jgi:diadenosine tetraphosphatase ApaH/serine/threonine PP2A family protein phosphatase
LRFLVFSDVHGNVEALEAVLDDASRRGYDRVICLGDTVGYGADPEECVKIASGLPDAAAVLGNHDAAVIQKHSLDYLNPVAQAGVNFSKTKLSEESLDYLRSLPLVIDSAGGFVACHASPSRPEAWLYVLEPPEAREAFRAMGRPVAFIGHTHFPLLHDGSGKILPLVAGESVALHPRVKFIINVGSVGQPRDGDPRTAFAIFDDANRMVHFFRVEYDVDRAARKILEAGLPEMLADRIQRGY